MKQEVNPEVCDEVLYLTYKARIYPNSTQEKAITATSRTTAMSII